MNRLIVCFLAALAGMAVVTSAQSDSIFVVRQDVSTGMAELSLISLPFGDVRIVSNLTFSFEFPLVECTVDTENRLVYLVTIDVVSGGSIMYTLDERLNVVNKWTTPGTNDFFDLQYNAYQSALYGISVVSRYGRVLSNITAVPGNNNISIDHLVAMPMGWYVNASSFDGPTNRYFALINQFPGNANWTNAQQLVVADFSGIVTPAPAQFYPLPQPQSNGGIIHFLGYNWDGDGGRSIWALSVGPGVSNPSPNTLTLVSLNSDTGEYEAVADFGQPGQYDIGPLVVDSGDQGGNPYFFCRDTSSGLWMLVVYDVMRTQQFHVVRRFMDSSKAFRAVAYAPW